jgi:hypothetical protein
MVVEHDKGDFMKNSINKLVFVALIALILGFAACSNPAGGSGTAGLNSTDGSTAGGSNPAGPKLILDFGTDTVFVTAPLNSTLYVTIDGNIIASFDPHTHQNGIYDHARFIITTDSGVSNFKAEIDMPPEYLDQQQHRVQLVTADNRQVLSAGSAYQYIVFDDPVVTYEWPSGEWPNSCHKLSPLR